MPTFGFPIPSEDFEDWWILVKVAEGIFDVMAVFNATMEYVLYYHSGRKTIRAFRRKDGKMIANFRVQADLKGMETTTDGRFLDNM